MIFEPENYLPSKPFAILFVILQLMFGFDFGFSEVAPCSIRRPLKILCLLVSANFILLAAKMMFCGHRSVLFVFVTNFIEYSCYSLACVSTKYNMYDFFRNIAVIDVNLNVERNEFDNLFIKITAYVSISLVIRILTTMIYCFCSSTSVLCLMHTCDYPIIYSLPALARDIPYIVQYSIMYTVYRRIHILNVKLGTKALNEKTFLMKYREILDCMNKIKPMFSKLVIFQVLILSVK